MENVLYFYNDPLFSHLNQNFSLYLWLHIYSYTKNEFFNLSFEKTIAASLKLKSLALNHENHYILFVEI